MGGLFVYFFIGKMCEALQVGLIPGPGCFDPIRIQNAAKAFGNSYQQSELALRRQGTQFFFFFLILLLFKCMIKRNTDVLLNGRPIDKLAQAFLLTMAAKMCLRFSKCVLLLSSSGLPEIRLE